MTRILNTRKLYKETIQQIQNSQTCRTTNAGNYNNLTTIPNNHLWGMQELFVFLFVGCVVSQTSERCSSLRNTFPGSQQHPSLGLP